MTKVIIFGTVGQCTLLVHLSTLVKCLSYFCTLINKSTTSDITLISAVQCTTLVCEIVEHTCQYTYVVRKTSVTHYVMYYQVC